MSGQAGAVSTSEYSSIGLTSDIEANERIIRDAQTVKGVREGQDVEKGTKLETLPEHDHEHEHEHEDEDKNARHLDRQHPEELKKGQFGDAAQPSEPSGEEFSICDVPSRS